MKVTIQIVENTDRIHVSQDGIPMETIMFNDGKHSFSKHLPLKEDAMIIAESMAYKTILKAQVAGFTIKVLNSI